MKRTFKFLCAALLMAGVTSALASVQAANSYQIVLWTNMSSTDYSLSFSSGNAYSGIKISSASFAITGTALNSSGSSQTITFSSLSDQTLGSGPFTLSATTSSTLPVSFSSTSTACSVSSNTVTLLTTGTCTIAANQNGDSTYSTAPTVTQSFTVNAAATTPQASLIAGWNLLGNSVNTPLAVPSAFGNNINNVSTVWKWETTGNSQSLKYPVWAFYTPSLSVQDLATYAASKGYDVLTSIKGGEGFWVNANAPFSLSLPAGTAIASTAFADQPSGINNLPAGWSLLATGNNPTPKAFANAISLNPPAIGAANSLTTLWAWDSTQKNWYFYAPGLDNAGTLTSYISNKSYLDFAGSATSAAKTLDPTTGFWVNHSSASITSMISTSGNVFCALNTNSQMYCWGAGANGLIGSNVVCRGPGYCSSLQSFPIAVTSSSGTGNLSGVRQIANDYFNTCALMQTGIVRCWGENNFGEMGNGTTQPWYNVYPSDTVVDINGTGSLSQVRSIAAGGFSSCAALASGALACWGMEQGSSPPNYTATPILIAGIDNVGTLSGVSAVSVGLQSSCALLTGGAVACWGDNSAGELGSILITNDKGPTSTYPQLVSGTGSNGTVITSVAVGAWHACALTQTGGVMCWGWNMSGQLGIGVDPVVQEFAYAPTPVLGSSGNGALTGIVAVTSGDFHSCALTSAGTVYCWGGNTFGQLGNNSSAASENLPVQVTGVGGVNFLTGVTQITAGGSSTCALLSSGNMVCWGQGAALGDPNNSSSTPVYQVDTSGTGMLNLGH